VCDDAPVLYRRLIFGLILAAWRIWRRMPPKQRRQMLDAARRHGPRLASSVVRRRDRARS
jgi:hypothetical protein